MITLNVSKIENALARRTLIVTTFAPVLLFNLAYFTASLVLYWAKQVVVWPFLTFKEARNVW